VSVEQVGSEAVRSTWSSQAMSSAE